MKYRHCFAYLIVTFLLFAGSACQIDENDSNSLGDKQYDFSLKVPSSLSQVDQDNLKIYENNPEPGVDHIINKEYDSIKALKISFESGDDDIDEKLSEAQALVAGAERYISILSMFIVNKSIDPIAYRKKVLSERLRAYRTAFNIRSSSDVEKVIANKGLSGMHEDLRRFVRDQFVYIVSEYSLRWDIENIQQCSIVEFSSKWYNCFANTFGITTGLVLNENDYSLDVVVDAYTKCERPENADFCSEFPNEMGGFRQLDHASESCLENEAKVVVYEQNGTISHAAIQDQDKFWYSKLGRVHLIRHGNAEDLEPLYGKIVAGFCKARSQITQQSFAWDPWLAPYTSCVDLGCKTSEECRNNTKELLEASRPSDN